MDIHVPDNQLRAALADEAACRKRYGADMSKKIFLRVGSLRAAESLHTFWPPMRRPERCHELTGGLAGMFSMDVKQPYRLLFKPFGVNPKSSYANDQEYWKAIIAIELDGIEDTHG